MINKFLKLGKVLSRMQQHSILGGYAASCSADCGTTSCGTNVSADCDGASYCEAIDGVGCGSSAGTISCSSALAEAEAKC